MNQLDHQVRIQYYLTVYFQSVKHKVNRLILLKQILF